eukprot:TRINITY_DN55637_c0_g1_i1.p2 TRINITY_DN55637_c0_g1~~TRINITY_DN55637_c0_g1_i1.p2  ORF type:complete len:108 (-),score=41.31 TRINITY_DN55637_c0_g1_i1:48-371(-)
MLTRPPQECTFAMISQTLQQKANEAAASSGEDIPIEKATTPVSISSALTPQQIADIKATFSSVPVPEVVDATLKKLEGLGFEVTHRNPQTSAGTAMTDRVILKYKGE